MSESHNRSNAPKSIRQRRILDLAADEPDASYADIAERVPSASADLVERVLEEYGDPAPPMPAPADGDVDESEDDTESETPNQDGDASGHSDAEATPARVDLDSLSAKDRETLRAIYEHPSATQQEIADVLDVSRATVSNRIRDIDGFEWADRASLTAALFGSDDDGASTTDKDDSSTDADSAREAEIAKDDATSESPDEIASEPDGTPTTDTISEPGAEAEASHAPDIAAEDVDRLTDAVEELSDRLGAVERRLDAIEADAGERESKREDPEASPFDDPEFVHKVVHACMDAEQVTEDEERRLIRAVLQR
ncbi:winged helix-turn-helix transcriptional regulator [Halobellus rubicundus]|uniref:Winged helix-turn-helix transcriptional regulator n=1 Tax=Halobellus rubicundus TaxID=2996466 RepID=A0ABD5MI01_9EURY